MSKRKVEFVSYSGKPPGLCYGVLTLRIDGREVVCEQFVNENWVRLASGGDFSFDEDGNENVTEGPWTVEVSESLEDLKSDIEKLIYDNIPYGCCGGCV